VDVGDITSDSKPEISKGELAGSIDGELLGMSLGNVFVTLEGRELGALDGSELEMLEDGASKRVGCIVS
jgi:hypothetical protein